MNQLLNNGFHKRRLIIISGPSGVGKGSIIQALLEQDPTLGLAISATTRQPRPGEVARQAYYFLSEAEFDQQIANAGFLEWCQVFSQRYGTLTSELTRFFAQGQDVLLEIDVQGAAKVRAKVPNLLTIFIAPPDRQALRARLSGRQTESPAAMQERWAIAELELAAMKDYDYVVINDDLNQAIQDTATIITAVRADKAPVSIS